MFVWIEKFPLHLNSDIEEISYELFFRGLYCKLWNPAQIYGTEKLRL